MLQPMLTDSRKGSQSSCTGRESKEGHKKRKNIRVMQKEWEEEREREREREKRGKNSTKADSLQSDVANIGGFDSGHNISYHPHLVQSIAAIFHFSVTTPPPPPPPRVAPKKTRKAKRRRKPYCCACRRLPRRRDDEERTIASRRPP